MFELINGDKSCRVLFYEVPSGREILQEAPFEILNIISDAIRAVQSKLSIFSVGREGVSGEEGAKFRTQGNISKIRTSSPFKVMSAKATDCSWKNSDSVIESISSEIHGDGASPISKKKVMSSNNNLDVGHPKISNITSSRSRQQELSQGARGDLILDHVGERLIPPKRKDSEKRHARRITHVEQLQGEPESIFHLALEHDHMTREDHTAAAAECHHRCKISRISIFFQFVNQGTNPTQSCWIFYALSVDLDRLPKCSIS